MIHVLKYQLLKPAMEGNVKPFLVEFRDGINLIVGENGCGKSTMLKYMSDRDRARNDGVEDRIAISDESKGVRTMYFDTEKNNPRMTGPKSVASADVISMLMSKMQSHGETLFPILEYIGRERNVVALIDEPESGISIPNQKKLWAAFNAAADANEPDNDRA